MLLVQWRTVVIGSFLKKGHYLWSKYRFKLSPPNENATELFSVIVQWPYKHQWEFQLAERSDPILSKRRSYEFLKFSVQLDWMTIR